MANQSAPYNHEVFFKRLEEVLVKNIGPVASYIIDDVLVDLNMERGRVKKEDTAQITEAIGQQIGDEDKRLKFQQEMLQYLKLL